MRDEDACHSSMAASKLLSGGSLPPRKRLLVGLKQNGWSISCTPPSCPSSNSDAAGGAAMTAGNEDDGFVEAPGGMEAQKQVKEGCARCGGCENSAWRRLKKGGIYQRFCNPCVLLYSTNLYCPHCLGLYRDVSNLEDRSVWIVCCKCQRSVHVACESENPHSKAPDPLSYLCPNCRTPKSPTNGIFGSREKLCTENKGAPVNCTKSKEEGFVETPFDNLYFRCNVSKKPRRETRTNLNIGVFSALREGLGLGHGSSASTSSGASPACKPSLATAPVSPQEAASAAKAAAYMAAKAAAAAKATAAAKASVAVKAAAAAKAALVAAAFAARAEERAREELSCRSGVFETHGQAAARIQITVGSEREAGENIDKAETSVDDEELARQLHRVMNSSPRITRSATPFSKKIEIKTEVDVEAKAFAHGGSCSSEEPLPFPKPQLTRPRSFIHKENKRWEPKFSNFDNAKLDREKIENALQPSTSETAPIKDEIASGHQYRSSPSACNEHSDSNMVGANKPDAVNSLNTPTNDKSGVNLKIHSLGNTLFPVICDDSTKVGYKIKKIAVVTPCEAANLSLKEAKAKQGGVLDRHSDDCMKIEDGNRAFRVIKEIEVNMDFCAGNKSGAQSQVSEAQTHSREDRIKRQGVPEKKVAKIIEKQKLHNWKSVYKLLSSADNKRVVSDTRTLSFTGSSEDNEGKLCIGIRNGVKNGEHVGGKSNFKPFFGVVDNQHAQFKGTANRHEAEQSLSKRKVPEAEEAVSIFGSTCKVKNLKVDLTSRQVDRLKSNKLASVPNAMPLKGASSSASVICHSLSDQP